MSKSLLNKRLKKSEQEKALQIINDVAEDIDNRDTRADLRMAIQYLSLSSLDRDSELAALRYDLKMIRLAHDLMSINLRKYRTKVKP